MKIIPLYQYPDKLEQANDNVRYLADSLNDGQHEINIKSGQFSWLSASSVKFASANITSATITSANFTAGASINSATIGTLQGLLKGTAGKVEAIASGTTAQYLRGDASFQALNQAAVAGLTTTDSPTFAAVNLGDTNLSDYKEGSWNPTVTSQSGSITSYTATGDFTKFGDVYVCQIHINITNNGTGATALICNLPETSSGQIIGCGRDNGVSGKMIQGYNTGSGQVVYMRNYDDSYPGATNADIYMLVVYKV